MADLLAAVTEDTVGDASSALSGPSTVYVKGVPDGATVALQISDTTNTADFVSCDRSIIPQDKFVNRTGSASIGAYGSYYLRAVLDKAGSNTNMTVSVQQ